MCVPRGGKCGLFAPGLLSLLLHPFLAGIIEPLLMKLRAGEDLRHSLQPLPCADGTRQYREPKVPTAMFGSTVFTPHTALGPEASSCLVSHFLCVSSVAISPAVFSHLSALVSSLSPKEQEGSGERQVLLSATRKPDKGQVLC